MFNCNFKVTFAGGSFFLNREGSGNDFPRIILRFYPCVLDRQSHPGSGAALPSALLSTGFVFLHVGATGPTVAESAAVMQVDANKSNLTKKDSSSVR